MIIERELIKKAKEKLGNRNAELISEILEISDFDTKNLKSRCPYHSESTPSFIYNPKNQNFKCFGCGKSVDLIDVLVEKGSSFLDAAKFLFEKADMDYSFGEQAVKTKRNYRYPREETNTEKPHSIEYWGKRKISKNVLDYLDVREDDKGNSVFNYYDTNDVLTMIKYRPARSIPKGTGQIKTWCQKDSDTTPLLFNMNRVNTSKPLLITEGEADTASAIEAGYLNTVSVPFGAGNFTWIEENWEWLNQFDTIIVWSDNDEPGLKMRKECLYRLGTWRTKYIAAPEFYEKNGKRIPLSDINDCLQVGGKEFVMQLIQDAKDVPVTSVVDYSELEELDVSQMDGVKTGIKPIDNELIKIFYGTLTVLSGRPGCVDCETEFFDGKQWKSIAEYQAGDKVLQYNADGTA
ncbi:MAG: CHC2 zinc finger domain-containing protein, partial [Ruminococcus sp.]|nr:CHC2 zinc finger domain-containing protein [Ruminococcus sp.]